MPRGNPGDQTRGRDQKRGIIQDQAWQTFLASELSIKLPKLSADRVQSSVNSSVLSTLNRFRSLSLYRIFPPIASLKTVYRWIAMGIYLISILNKIIYF